ncbi:MAG: hypothetical protein ABIQ95_17210 [Bdellovibrionia bacterium]
MSFDRLVKNVSGLMAAVLLIQNVSVAHAASSDPASREMLREIYTRLNEVNATSQKISVEAELEYFEKNVKDVESAQEFIRSLFSLIHPDPDFNPRAKLHPLLEDIRQAIPSEMKVEGLISKVIDAKETEEEREFNRFILFVNTSILAMTAFSVGFMTSVVSSQLHCLDLCRNALLTIPEGELLTRGGEFPGVEFVCQAYIGDRDSTRHSNNPRFNYNAIDQQIGTPHCMDSNMTASDVFNFGVACAALPLGVYFMPRFFHAGQKIYRGGCQVAELLKKYWSKTESGLSLPSPLGAIFNKIENELGIRHMDQISVKVVGLRVIVRPCSNEFDRCPICFVDFTGFEGSVATECCTKKFCKVCLEGWFESLEDMDQAKNCPYCRTRLLSLQASI